MSYNFERILIIDDDPIHNFISARSVKKYLNNDDLQVLSFTRPQEGIQYIIKTCSEEIKIILFLDLNMPGFSGWDVLAELKRTVDFAAGMISIYVLSSSIDPDDKERACQYPMVSGYLAKPLFEHLPFVFKNV